MAATKIRFRGGFKFRAYIAMKLFFFSAMLLNPWCEGVEMEITQPDDLRDMPEADFNEAHEF
jgi:hypothetical protein